MSKYIVLGVLIGTAVGAIGGTVAILTGIISGIVGYFLGQSKAFTIKLQAQTALCQVKIEENTRKTANA